jgi:hypothetical protein
MEGAALVQVVMLAMAMMQVIEYFAEILERENMESLSADVVLELIAKGMLSWRNMLLVVCSGTAQLLACDTQVC